MILKMALGPTSCITSATTGSLVSLASDVKSSRITILGQVPMNTTRDLKWLTILGPNGAGMVRLLVMKLAVILTWALALTTILATLVQTAKAWNLDTGERSKDKIIRDLGLTNL